MRPRILSIRQPWAALIVHHTKDIENRTWLTHYRGLVFIHASLAMDRKVEEYYSLVPQPMQFGGIIGIARITDCVRKHPSKWFVGPHGFVLADARPLPFLKLKGALSLREAPDEVMTFYAQQLKEIKWLSQTPPTSCP